MMRRLVQYIPEHWFRNYKVKLFSLLGALFIWFYVITDNYFEVTIRVPLQLVNFPQGYILANDVPSHIKVLFRGSGKSLLGFYYRDKSIELDLHQIKKPAIFRLDIGMINGMSPGINVAPLRIVTPDSVLVKLDRFAARQVPVESALSMTPMDGYTQIGDVRLVPDSLIVSGPKTLVDAIASVSTAEKEFTKVHKPVKGKISLRLEKRDALQYSVENVFFSGDIQRIGERYLSGIPVQVLNVPSNLNVSVVPSSLSLRLQGGVSLLENLDKDDVVATIDYRSRYRYQHHGIPANIKLPKEITFSDVHPKFFDLRVDR